MKLAQLHAFEIDLNDAFRWLDAGVLGKRGAERYDKVGRCHAPAGDRCAGAPENAGGIGVRVGDQPLGLEGGEHRRAEFFGKCDDHRRAPRRHHDP